VISERPQQRPGLNVRRVGDETIVLDRASNQVHHFNVTAGFVWQRCDGRHTVEEMASELVAAYDVDLETARKAVDTALGQLDSLGLLASEPR
jgi:Coenzyme PQQ synthesis protein D (PqqD)